MRGLDERWEAGSKNGFVLINDIFGRAFAMISMKVLQLPVEVKSDFVFVAKQMVTCTEHAPAAR